MAEHPDDRPPPTPPQVQWGRFELTLSASGEVGAVRLDGQLLLDRLQVRLPGPWQPADAELLADEVSIAWLHPSGARARVRQVWDATWSIRVTLHNPSHQIVRVPGPQLLLEGPWPIEVWAAHSRAAAWVQTPGPGVLAARLTRGSAELDGGRLVSGELELGAAGSARENQTWAWSLELTTRGALGSVLPQWWPGRVTGQRGEDWTLALPDGRVSGSGVTLQDEGFVVVPPDGHTRYIVDQLAERTVLDLWVAPPLEDLVAGVLGDHPMRPGPVDPALSVLAAAARTLGLDADLWEDQLAVAAELAEQFAGEQAPTADPLALLAVALACPADPDLAGSLVDWTAPLAAPGSALAIAQARWTAVLHGVPAPRWELPTPAGLAGAVVQAERDLLRGERSAAGARMTAMLGGELPSRPLISDEWWAVVLSAAGYAPEDSGLGLDVQQHEHRLLAQTDDLRALAWLVSAAVLRG